MNQDAWVANLSDGASIVEHWIPNELSPWLRLMDLCKTNNLYLTNLRLTICSKTVSLRPRSVAYWQMHQCTLLSGGDEIPVVRGIGFVEDNKVKIVWGTRVAEQPHFWSEERPIDNQGCIIWAPKYSICN